MLLARRPTLEETGRWWNDAQGMFLIAVFFAGALLPLPILPIAMLTKVDPFYYVFEEILPHPYIRSPKLIVGSLMIRFVLMFLACYEFSRFMLTHIVLVFILFLSAMLSFLKSLRNFSSKESIEWYVKFKVTLSPVHTLLGHLVGGLVPWAHFGTVVCLWLAIDCWELISEVVAFILLLLAMLIFGGTVLMMFPEVTKLGTVSELLIRKNRNYNFSRRPNIIDQRYYYYLLWKAQKIAALPCASYFTMGSGFTMQYAQELFDNLLSVLLVFDPV